MILNFVLALLIIVVAAELFTNATEWAGYRLHLGQGATGSLLAGIGTALPETVVPIVALVHGAPSASRVATGAVLGSSFLLLTLGVAFTGAAVMSRRQEPSISVAPGQVHRDLGAFVIAFTLVCIAMLLPQTARYGVGAVLIAIYAGYVVVTVRGREPAESMPEPLHLTRWQARASTHWVFIATQLVIAVAGLVLGSNIFVSGLTDTATALHVDALVLALIVVPVATELPETLNSILWIRSRDDGLAFGNVAGSATFQACILGAIGVVFTPWRPGSAGVVGAGLTLITALWLLWRLRHGHARGATLLLAGIPWVVYVVLAIATHGAVGASAS